MGFAPLNPYPLHFIQVDIMIAAVVVTLACGVNLSLMVSGIEETFLAD
jgi:hypothetical protein